MILTYHEVIKNDSCYLYGVTPAEFDSHIALVAEVQRRNTEPFSTSVVTFDDGHRSNYDLAWPLLEKHGVFAMFFVTTDWIGKRQTFMDWCQLREMQEQGHTIGAHGVSHKLLTHCSASVLRDEVRRSKQTIEDALGQEVASISMPGGRWNRRVLEACRDAGYRHLYHSDAGTRARRFAGIEVRGRLMVHRGMMAGTLRRYLTRDPSFLFALRCKNTFKAACKQLIGDALYSKAWVIFSSKERADDN